jgi:type VI secretion system secreted protein Hcp
MKQAKGNTPNHLAVILILAAIGWGAQPAIVLADAFLKIEGIAGESIDEFHTGWIDVQTVGGGIARPTDLTAAHWDALRVIKPIDKSSPLLFRACASGELIPRAILEWVRGQPERRRYYRIVLENVLISSVQTSATAGDTPTETVDLVFGKMTWTYTELNQAGLPLADHRAYWDVLRNEGGLLEVPPFRASGTQSEPGQLRLSWPAEAGQTYRIRSTPDLGGDFAELDRITAESDGWIEVTLPTTSSSRFFVVEEAR